MADRRKGNPWGMVQAITAAIGLMITLGISIYTKVESDVMSQVNTLASTERLNREKIVTAAVEKLEASLLLKIDRVSGDLQGLEDAIHDIETDIAIIQGQQIADAEVRKLVQQVNNTLIELKGDVKTLKEKSAGVDDIAVQLGVLSSQITTIQKKLGSK